MQVGPLPSLGIADTSSSITPGSTTGRNGYAKSAVLEKVTSPTLTPAFLLNLSIASLKLVLITSRRVW